jgi:RNA polymerase sigma-70 factor (ECF subfamily)
MYRLTTNVCIDFLRSRGRGTAASLTVENDDEELEELELPDQRFDPQKELERRELRRAVQAGLESLSEDAREIVILRELEGLSYAEIGDRLGLEAGTVKSRLFRARKALCGYLIESGNIPDGFPSKQKKSGGEKA